MLEREGWKRSIRRMWQVQAAYCVAAISTDLFVGRPNAAIAPNRPLVLMGVAVFVVNLWLYRRRLNRLFTTRGIAVGAAVLFCFLINENIGRPLVPAVDLEPIGVFVFVVSLAYGVVGSVFRSEAELVAVQRELDTAREIQTSLLPRDLPRVRDLDVAVRYLPVTAVAGDLYDFVVLGPSRVGVLVADVAGHGVPAALVASMIKVAFSAQVDEAHDPARVLTAINRILCHNIERAFVTAIYGVIDTDRRAITIANAGHPPLLVGRADRSVEESREHGLLLGFLPDATYMNREIALEDGDRLLFYTDGIPETRNPRGDFFDEERMRRWLTSTDSRDATHFIDAAIGELSAWHDGGGFEDDVTFVVARFSASGSHRDVEPPLLPSASADSSRSVARQ
ncbi:MAG TPA: PP2C family protein-serine/threonine phosphatase [Vicinamibacterales bacterium]|jgi:hypothetical protein|nr:PP2C family protein-serine/threonine phosphatase [Vicinamibacterales bacterium]